MTIAQTAVANAVGITTSFVNNQKEGAGFLPQRIAVVGQGAEASTYSSAKVQALNSGSVGEAFGYGSPLHLAVKQLFPQNGDGVGTIPVTLYPLQANGSGIVSVGNITPTGTQLSTQVYTVKINNISSAPIVLAVDDVVADVVAKIIAAVNGVLEMPVIASNGTTKVDFTSKWKGASANDIFIEIEGTVDGVTFGITQPTGGLVNPDVQSALDLFGNTWETLVINCLDVADTTALDVYKTEGELRWGTLVKTPMIVFSGSNEPDETTASTLSESRPLDFINSQITVPGSTNLPFVLAARSVARIAKVANGNPPLDYQGQSLTGVDAGSDGQQWDFAKKDFAVKRGCSTTDLVDGVVELSDTVTFYHPSGEDLPPYRFVTDIIKVMNVLYNMRLIFESDNWKGKVLVPDDTVVANPEARKPKSAKAALGRMFDGLQLNAIVANAEFAKTNTTAAISSVNPKRIDIVALYQITGNTHIIDIQNQFSFFFGEVVA